MAMKGLHAEVKHWREAVARLQGEEAAGSQAAETAAQVAKYQDQLSVARLEAGLPAAQEAAQRLPEVRLRLQEAEQMLKTIEGLCASVAMAV